MHFTHNTSLRTSKWVVLSCFKLCIWRHKLFNYAWMCWTPRLGSCIGVSYTLIMTYKALSWVVSLCCNIAFHRCGVDDATNHSQCYPSVNVMFASWIVHFSLWSNSHGVSPGSIMISLNPMINFASDFGLLNTLFSGSCISTIPTFDFHWNA